MAGTTPLEVLYRLRDMAGRAADPLREAIRDANIVLEALDKFADDSEHVAQLGASSTRFPTWRADPPADAGLVPADVPAGSSVLVIDADSLSTLLTALRGSTVRGASDIADALERRTQ